MFNLTQKQDNDKSQRECKNYRKCKKDYSWNPGTCICGNGKDLKSFFDTSVIACDEFIIAKDRVSTNIRNTIPTNMTNTLFCQRILIIRR